MAVNLQTAWTDTTEVLVITGAARLKAVEVEVDPDGAAEVFIQIWDVVDPTPGTTAPRIVLPVPLDSNDNRILYKYVFAAGLYFATAISWFVSTTHDGGTAPTGADLPEVSRLYYEPVGA